MAREFTVFVGVKGARHYEVAVVHRVAQSWKTSVRDAQGRKLTLSRFAPVDMANLLDAVPGLERSRLCGIADAAWIVGSAVGLPSSTIAHRHPGAVPGSGALWREIVRTRRFTHEGRASGPTTAEAFFAHLGDSAVSTKKRERRKCEVISRAADTTASTFRLWKDMAEARDGAPWLNLWPMDSVRAGVRGRPWVFEGHPRMEAAHLAEEALRLQCEDRLWEPFSGFRKMPALRFEGWMIGLRR